MRENKSFYVTGNMFHRVSHIKKINIEYEIKINCSVDILLLFLFKGFPYSIFEFVEGSIK